MSMIRLTKLTWRLTNQFGESFCNLYSTFFLNISNFSRCVFQILLDQKYQEETCLPACMQCNSLSVKIQLHQQQKQQNILLPEDSVKERARFLLLSNQGYALIVSGFMLLTSPLLRVWERTRTLRLTILRVKMTNWYQLGELKCDLKGKVICLRSGYRLPLLILVFQIKLWSRYLLHMVLLPRIKID